MVVLGQTRTVSGKVVEAGTGEVLPFATIFVEHQSIATTSNLDGFFSLFNVPETSTSLKVNYIGYNALTVELADFSEEPLVLELTPISAELDEVVVTANAYKVLDMSNGVSKATISTSQLFLLPSIGETDIFRSLQLLPGVSGTNENSSGLFVRGGTPDQNLVLLDGMTVYNVDHFFGFFSAFNTNAVKDVQFYKGAFPARFGGRTSSVIELTGKTGNFEKMAGGFNVNFLSANGYFETPLGKRFSLILTGRRSYTDIIQSSLFNSLTDNLLGNDEFDQLDEVENVAVAEVEPVFYFYDWNGKLSFRPTDRDMITLSVYKGQDFLDESRDIDIDIPIPDPQPNLLIAIDVDDKTNWGNQGSSMKWSRQWNPQLYSNFLVAGSEYFSDYQRDGFLAVSIPDLDSLLGSGGQVTVEENKVTDLTAVANFEWQPNSNYKLDYGSSLTHTKVRYSNIRDDTLTILARDQEANYWSGYVSQEYEPQKGLKISTGLRLSYYDNSNRFLWEPRFSLSYQLVKGVKFKAGYGRHFQYVNRIINENITEGSRDFWLLADDELVDISEAHHLIGGFTYEFGGWLMDVEGYYKNLSGLSEFSLRFSPGIDATVDELFFTGTGEAKGVEFLLQKKSGRYSGWVSYTLGRVRHNFEGLNNGDSFYALHDQLHEIKVVQTYEVIDWYFSANFIYGSGRPFSEPSGRYSIELLNGRELSYVGVGPKNGSRLSPYHRMDVSVHRKFKIGEAKADLGFSIFNLYGRTNIWYKEFDFSQEPAVISDILYLGFTPNFSFKIDF